jgi:NAD(P)-dependent dehydrogenase (short-subunit alcohol dehydrogenase family)
MTELPAGKSLRRSQEFFLSKLTHINMKYPLHPPFPPSLSFVGQNVLITGGSSGLGLEAAIHFVKLGASVIITTRNEIRGIEALETITARTSKKGAVQARILDMDTFEGVRTFVDRLKKDVKMIDIVILNAGVSTLGYNKSPEGWEANLQTNLLSTTLAALLMLPWMRSVKQPGKQQHLGFVGSGTHLDIDILSKSFPKENVLAYWNDTKNYRARPEAYFRSKLFLEYAIREITKLSVVPRGR